jgi:tetratricopeptide (TPR) repeat protein
MILTIILLIVLGLAVIIFGVIVFRKLPQLKVIDPSSSKEAKAKELKQNILRNRFSRATAGHVNTLSTTMAAPLRVMQTMVRGAASKLTALERSYADRQKTGKSKLGDSELRSILEETRTLVNEEKYEAAEKRLIELISLDPKNTDAYELLGRLYILTKNYINAKETFMFVLKLSPKDASVHASLGEIAELEGDLKKAFDYFSKAKDLNPNNPKYLDFYIEAAIASGDYYDAEQGVARLEKVNPQNQKIPLFVERIKDGKKTK